MMSKNSFLVNMKENLKRRKGIAVLYSVFFLLCYPIGLTLYTASTKGYMDLSPNYRESLTESFSIYLGMNLMTALLVTLLAVICAIQGFSYLFKRQKLDMYMSVPVSKGHRFAIIYVNGILLYALPYLFSIMISLCIGAGSGVYVGKIVKTLIFSYLSYLIYYLAIYNITIIVVMLTGNTLLALCGSAIFLFYEGGIRVILVGMNGIFFRTFSSYADEEWYKMFFSPAIFFTQELMNDLTDQNVPYLLEKFGFLLIKLMVIAVISGIAGYLLYAIRPAESCNKAIAFKKIRPVIKVMLMVPVSLETGNLFYWITNSIAVTVLGFVLGIFLCHGILEVIFEFDLKAMFGSLRSMAVGVVCVFGIFAVYQFDLTGYDKWVPKPEQVESVAISMHVFSDSSIYDWETGNYVNAYDYAIDHMEITDTEKVCALMDTVVEEWEEWNKGDEDYPEEILWATVKYRMKNGTEKYRSIGISYEDHKEELNWLVSNEEFQAEIFQILDDKFMEKVTLKQIRISDGITGKDVEKEDLERVLQAYKEDLKQYNMELAAEQYPVRVIDFQFLVPGDPIADQYNQRELSIHCIMPVYENFEQTMAYLKDNGLEKNWFQNVYSIDSVTISHYSKEYEEWMNKDFTKEEEMEAILPALTPEMIGQYYKVFMEEESYEYTVSVSYKKEGDSINYDVDYFMVDLEMLPDFAK